MRRYFPGKAFGKLICELQNVFAKILPFRFPIFVEMRHAERNYFDALKELIVVRFRERYADCPDQLSEWKGKVIEEFQQDLQERVQGRISTRWFYDHLKSEDETKIPRIDILNLLSQYCGFESWEAFKTKKTTEGIRPFRPSKKAERKVIWPVMVFVLLIVLTGLTALITYGTDEYDTYQLCFADADFGFPLVDRNLKITFLDQGAGPSGWQADTTGCVQITGYGEEARFIVEADYYKTDTFELHVDYPSGAIIELSVDDYSLLIHQLSTTSAEDWNRRRTQLDQMISDEAIILLVAEDNQGIEMYNKAEFIDRMTMPISALKNLRILQTEYDHGKISKMRITQED